MNPIITSLLDTDLYKVSMQDFVYSNAPSAQVKCEFVCRNKDIKLGFLADEVREQIDKLGDLTFTDEDIEFLKKLRYIHPNYIQYLENGFRLYPKQEVYVDNINGQLEISIIGPWKRVILYEVPVLAIVNELYFRRISEINSLNWRETGRKNLEEKCLTLAQHPNLFVIEFGTRRRFNKEWQDEVFRYMRDVVPQNMVGTSNLFLARKYDTKAYGTIAHEVFSGYLSLVDDIRNAQRYVLYLWMMHFDTFNGPDLGIALSDTFTTKAFFEDFKYSVANAYAGVRHDSGDPVLFGNNVIEHYKKMGIDPRTKSIVFSDGLDVPTAVSLFEKFTGKIGVSFGIGTNLTNSVGFKPLNIVLKLVECNGKPCVKISDNISKAIGDPRMVDRVVKAYCV